MIFSHLSTRLQYLKRAVQELQHLLFLGFTVVNSRLCFHHVKSFNFPLSSFVSLPVVSVRFSYDYKNKCLRKGRIKRRRGGGKKGLSVSRAIQHDVNWTTLVYHFDFTLFTKKVRKRKLFKSFPLSF